MTIMTDLKALHIAENNYRHSITHRYCKYNHKTAKLIGIAWEGENAAYASVTSTSSSALSYCTYEHDLNS